MFRATERGAAVDLHVPLVRGKWVAKVGRAARVRWCYRVNVTRLLDTATVSRWMEPTAMSMRFSSVHPAGEVTNTLRHLRGEELITHLGAEYYD